MYLVIIYCHLFILLTISYAEAGLYNASDDVVILSKNNFFRKILQSEKIWNVEFYNSWCGHCIHFAPTYKQLAADLKGWTSVVQTAAIDCAEESSADICRAYVERGYPTMKLFGPRAEVNDTGQEYTVRTVLEIEAILIDYITNATLSGMAPASWPNMLPLVTVEHIWNEAKEHHKHLALIFEDDSSHVGRQVILDMSGQHNILVRRMIKGSMVKFGIKHFPSLFLVMKDGRFKELAIGKTERYDYTEALFNILHTSTTESKLSMNAQNQPFIYQMDKSHPNAKNSNEEFENVKEAVYMQDLESTLSYCLRQEIAIHKDIEGDKLNALKLFMRILVKYFPGQQEVSTYLLKINRWLSGLDFDLTGSHWLHNIDSLQSMDAFLPQNIKWIGCHGSKPQFRGYPCGMWTLFHTLTVNAYEASRNSPKHFYMEVLNAIKGYMKYFFGCSVCSSHFLKMTETIPSEVHSSKQAVLWLWHAHNQANKRLAGDESEDPMHKKVQFPPPSLCKECIRSVSEDGQIDWNEESVIDFLLGFYGSDYIVIKSEYVNSFPDEGKKDRNDLDWWERKQREKDLTKLTLLRKSKKEKLEEKKSVFEVKARTGKHKDKITLDRELMVPPEGRGLVSRSDMGLCAMFYFVCLVIILMLYYHFTIRRKNNIFKKHCPTLS